MTIQDIIDYLMKTSTNTNIAVLSSMLGEGDWTNLYEYVKLTPHNMNRVIVKQLLESGDGDSNTPRVARVGEARVGIDYVE